MALLFCLLAALLYAAEIVVTDKHLPRVSPVALTCFFGFGIMAFALPGVLMRHRAGELELPTGHQWWLVLLLCALAFLADWCHFSALHHRVGSILLAVFYLLLPVFCSVLKGEMPSARTVLAWVLGGIALLLVHHDLSGE